MPAVPQLVEALYPLVVTEGAPLGPIQLTSFLQSFAEDGPLHFTVQLEDGRALPAGLIGTSDGIVSGIPAQGTAGSYTVLVIAKNDVGESTHTFPLTILEKHAAEQYEFTANLKSQVWEALGKNLPLPEIGDLFARPLSPVEIYYLLQRYATLTIWDVYNLDPPSDKKIIDVGASPHYNVYDRGSCLIGAPKDLFSYERTLEDALMTAKAMSREVYNRGWTIEFAGFNKMIRAGWVEIQILSEIYNKPLEILHFNPTEADFKLYEAEVRHMEQLTKNM
jgi:hypothetical protein